MFSVTNAREQFDVCHAALNVLIANARGRLRYLAFLDDCLDLGSYEEEMAETTQYLEELVVYQEKLWEGHPIELVPESNEGSCDESAALLAYLAELHEGTLERSHITAGI